MDFIRSREDRNNLYNNVDLTPRSPSESDTLLSVAMEIEHANNSGYVHGGTIMRLVDTAAGIAAVKHARRRVVTATMDEMSFLAPVYIGDLLTVRARVNDAHHTSMEISVRVDVERIPSGEKLARRERASRLRRPRPRRQAGRGRQGHRRDRRGAPASSRSSGAP